MSNLRSGIRSRRVTWSLQRVAQRFDIFTLPETGTGRLRPLRLKHTNAVTLGIALYRCAKRHHVGSLFDTLVLCFEGKCNFWWQHVERRAMYVLVAEEATQKGFHQFTVCKDLHGLYGQLLQSRKHYAELQLQTFSVG